MAPGPYMDCDPCKLNCCDMHSLSLANNSFAVFRIIDWQALIFRARQQPRKQLICWEAELEQGARKGAQAYLLVWDLFYKYL